MSTMDWAKLAEPFKEISWRIQGKPSANGNARVVAYIDARDVQERLDTVVGPENWTFDWSVVSMNGNEVALAKGILTIYGVTKTDIGEAGNVEKSKGAVSDALKRAAVHFGIGRHLYALGEEWVKVKGEGNFITIADGEVAKLNAKYAKLIGAKAPQAAQERQQTAQATQVTSRAAQGTLPTPKTEPKAEDTKPVKRAGIFDWLKKKGYATPLDAKGVMMRAGIDTEKTEYTQDEVSSIVGQVKVEAAKGAA